MKQYPEPPRQPNIQKDCDLYAISYLAKLLGIDVTPKEVGAATGPGKRCCSLFLADHYGVTYEWSKFGVSDPHPRNFIAYGSSDGFKQWCLAFLNAGYYGFAAFPLVERLHHAVVMLEGDSESVLLADSVRGLIREKWDRFSIGANPPKSFPALVQCWVHLKANKVKCIPTGEEPK